MKRTGRDRDGRVIILPPTTAEEHIAVQRESKARTTLLQSIPDDHMRKSMLKQQFLEFSIGEAEGLHKGEDLEALWSLVKERFSTTKPKNFSDDFLLVTLGAMLDVEEESKVSLELLSFGVDAAMDLKKNTPSAQEGWEGVGWFWRESQVTGYCLGNFMPLKPDLSYTGLDEFAIKPVVENKSSEKETKIARNSRMWSCGSARV
nr:xylulose kinase-1 [Tanacetum cinerariifolium]